MNVIDVDSYKIRDMDVMDVDSYSKREVIDVDSYANNKAAETKNAKRDGADDAALANGQEKDDSKQAMLVQQPEKPRVVIKKAPIQPDYWVSEEIKKTYHVIEMGHAIYDAMLTQTNVEHNSNDFHVIQLLRANSGRSYMVYNRWGRVGDKGDIDLSGPYTSSDIAIRKFEEKFYLKTKNHWCERQNFVPYPKCYTWLELDYGKKEYHRGTSSRHVAKRTFGPSVARFMSLLCNIGTMTQEMADIGYDAEKLPLRNLSKSTIMKAYDILKLISEVIGESNRQLLEELSGEFYTIIPHDFGEKKLRECVINTPQKLKSKLEMVEALGEIEQTTSSLANCEGEQEDILFYQYQHLRCELDPVEATSNEFEMIEKYMKNTSTDAYGTSRIVQIFRVSKEGENERFKKYTGTKNRYLLWHGSRLTNWFGILSQGLRIAPAHVPLTGASFGRGIYFADMFSKSAMYSLSLMNSALTKRSLTSATTAATPRTGVLLLCEVAMGEIQELKSPNNNAHKLPPGKQSTKGLGKSEPSEIQVQADGVLVPIGKPKTNALGGLKYSEYVVHNEDQVKMRYLVQVNY